MTDRHSVIFALSVILFTACQKPSDSTLHNKFADPVIVKIADFADRRLGDSVQPYLNHENAAYRLEAVLAFASIQQISDINRIGRLLLMDSDAEVRRGAAFALGQLQDPSAERLLLGALVKEKVPENTMTMLEAYGKVTAQWKLEPEPFLGDSLRSTGLAWSLYRAGLRNTTGADANVIAMRLLATPFPASARLGAAHFFARGATDFQDAESALIVSSTTDDSPDVRMAAALALGKIGTDSSLATIRRIITKDKDARVVVNAVRALRNFPFSKSERILYECLHHKDSHVGIAASEVIRDRVDEPRWIMTCSQINYLPVSEWRIIANLYDGALRAGQHKDLADEIQDRYNEERDPFARAALLGALSHFTPSLEFIHDAVKNADTAIVRTAAAGTLVAMNRSPNFKPVLRKRFAEIYADVMRSTSDIALIGTIATAFADSTLGYREIVKDYSFLKEAKEKLQLPRDIEAMRPLEAAIAYLGHRPPPEVNNEYNHPIDWQLVTKIPKGLIISIKTTRGSMATRLFVEEAPGSVANFISLAQQGYFNNRFFHRVVPNFVIQTGCNRGDGWGAESYSIRSEFSQRRYTTGSIGLASAGKDTESTQWFVTHSPTPHLDGRYTIFGEIVEGRKVADYIQMGDRITGVDLGDFKDQ